MKDITDVLGAASGRAILRSLFAAGDYLTGKELAKRSGVNYQQTYNVVELLATLGIVEHRVFGPFYLFRIKPGNPLAELIAVKLHGGEAYKPD